MSARALIASHALVENLLKGVPAADRAAMIILLGRACVVRLARETSDQAAAEKAYQWADEIATRRIA